MQKESHSVTDSSTELWEQRACRLALFSTAALTACRRRDGTGWVWGGDFLSRLPARAHPQPVHTEVSFLEQPRLACSNAGSQERPLCNVRT